MKTSAKIIIGAFVVFIGVQAFANRPGNPAEVQAQTESQQKLHAMLDECGGGYAAQMWHYRTEMTSRIEETLSADQIKGLKDGDREKGDNLTMQALRAFAGGQHFEQVQRVFTRQANEAGDSTIDQMYQQGILSCVFDVLQR